MEHELEEISLQELAAALWARRKLITILTVACTLLALATAFLLPVKYEADVLLSPVDNSDSGKFAAANGLISQLGDLAALGGILLTNNTQRDESIATLQSAQLTEGFIADHQLLPVLFADDWDAKHKRWTTDADDTPTLWKAEKKFRKKIRTVDEDKKTGLVTLTIEWTDPQQAADWANELVARANRELRDRAIAVSQRNLTYLNEQIGKTSVVELQQALYALIDAEIKKVMIAKGNEEYAFKVIDPARVPEEKSSPMRLLITAAGAVTGLLFGMMLALALPGIKRSSDPRLSDR